MPAGPAALAIVRNAVCCSPGTGKLPPFAQLLRFYSSARGSGTGHDFTSFNPCTQATGVRKVVYFARAS